MAVGVPATLRVVGSTYLRRLWPLLAAQAVPLAPAVLVVALLLPGMGPVLVDGTVTLTDPPDTEMFVTRIVITVVSVCVTVAAGSVAVVGCGALLGRDVPFTEAWKRSLRRLPTLLLWAVLIAALTVGTWKMWSDWWSPEEPLAQIGTLLLVMVVVVFLLAVSSMALVVALVEDRGPFEAVGTAWDLGTERRSAPMLFAVLAVVGTTLTTAGAMSLSDRLATLGVNQLLGLTAMGTLVFLTTPLWLVLLLCAPVVHSGRSAPRDLDLAQVDRTLPAGGVPSWRRTALSAVLLAPVVALPIAAVPASLALGSELEPLPQMVADPLDGLSLRPEDAVSTRGNTAMVKARATYEKAPTPLWVCDPVCVPGPEHHSSTSDTFLPTEDGSFATKWREEHSGPSDEKNGLYLLTCSSPQGCAEGEEIRLRPYSERLFTLDSAIDLGPEGIVVASYAQEDNPPVEHAPMGLQGGLYVHTCDDTDCTEPLTVDLTEKIFHPEAEAPSFHHVDVAASPHAGFAVTTHDATNGNLALTYCPDSACDDPVTSSIGEGGRHANQEFGARVAYRPDDTPVVVFRDAGSGTSHLVDCHDTACTDSTVHELAELGGSDLLPGLAIDTHGTPHVLGADQENTNLVLVVCSDDGCTERSTVPLRSFDDPPSVVDIALDDHDRPHIVWDGRREKVFPTPGLSSGSEYLFCREARCGLPT